jgi:ribosomal protein L11 methyltransferase
MKWVELSVETDPEFVEPLSQVFIRYGKGGVAVEELGGHNPDEGEQPSGRGPVAIKTYVPLDSFTDDRRNHIDMAVRLVGHLGHVTELRERVLEEQEWQDAWKKHFYVLHIGERIAVVPTWRRYRAKASDVVVLLDPGMAFGTGHHPTTRACLELLESLVRPGMSVLDVGCGSGILAIASVKLGAARAFGLEIDPVAVESAKANVLENGVADSVRVVEGTLPHPEAPAGSFDLAMANISSKVVSELAPHLARAVAPGGTVVASGIIDGQSAAAMERLEQAGLAVVRRHESDDWVTLVCSVA